MQLRQAYLQLEGSNGRKHYVLQPDKANSFDEIHVHFQGETEGSGTRYSLFLHPKEDIVVLDLAVEFAAPLAPDAQFFANGYQSWSESRLLPVGAEIPRLRRLARPFMGYSGDAHIAGIPHGPGYLHSWTYTYITGGVGDPIFLGSLAEHTGFTLFLWDQANQILTVRKDIRGLHLAHSFPGLDFWLGRGSIPQQFEQYFHQVRQVFNFPEPQLQNKSPFLGWTSWYRHFTNISAALILKNAEALAASGLPFQTVQIDDGWQTAVGDWRSVKPTFPEGMGALAEKIKALNLRPGLWLAPFVAAANSQLVRQHPDWLLKDSKGRNLRAGWNPMWGGWFYALNFYHPGVQDYLSGVFHIILDKWGYELLKLDFLYTVCLAPPKDKTRGQVMWEAMEFLRRQLGDRTLLACGVPLGAAFGQADICRIGGDIHLRWEHRLLAFLRHRERVSTLASLHSTLGRWSLNGQGFINDPDVFILREEHQQLSPVQQNTVLTLNALLGGVLFTSDDLGDYSPEQVSELEEALAWMGARVRSVQEIDPEVFQILFDKEVEGYVALVNLGAKPIALDQNKNGRIEIQPFETIILNKR